MFLFLFILHMITPWICINPVPYSQHCDGPWRFHGKYDPSFMGLVFNGGNKYSSLIKELQSATKKINKGLWQRITVGGGWHLSWDLCGEVPAVERAPGGGSAWECPLTLYRKPPYRKTTVHDGCASVPQVCWGQGHVWKHSLRPLDFHSLNPARSSCPEAWHSALSPPLTHRPML